MTPDGAPPWLVTFDSYVRRLIGVALVITAFVFVGWALLLVFLQCLGWLQAGIWQPVPFYAVCLSPEAQEFNLSLGKYSFSPLGLAPSLGDSTSLDEVAHAFGGRMVGLTKIASWVFDLPLALWLVLGASACGHASAKALEN